MAYLSAPVRTTTVASARVDRICYAIGALLVASGAFHLLVFLVAGGPWDGPVSWRKPLTFGLSFGLTLIAVTWLTSYLTIRTRARAVLLRVFAADCVLEVGGITLQAWRHVPSHFNTSTGFDTVVAMSLAFGGAVLVVVLTCFALSAFRHRPGGPDGMPLAFRAGFALLLVGLAAGAGMIARGVALSKGGDLNAAYGSTGFLKPLHAVGLHAVLVLPALAWLLDRGSWSRKARERAVRLGVAAYVLTAVGAAAWGVLAD